MEDVNISKFRAQVVRSGSTPANPGFVVSEGQNPVDPSGSGQNHLPVTIGSPANGLAVTDSQILTIDKAQIFAGTASQFVKGDGTLDSNTYLTTGSASATYVPYTGATADVNLGTHDLAAERGTFANNGSSDTLTVNHTSGSGYGIIVTKGGNNEALYVSKTSGSGNAMTVVGGRTSLVDLALSSVTNTAGDFLTLSGGVVHKRTAAQTLTDIGGQAALTNPVTGTGTTNYLPKFTGSTTIGNSLFTENGTNGAFGGANYSAGTNVRTFNISAPIFAGIGFFANNQYTGDIFSYGISGNLIVAADPSNIFSDSRVILATDGTERLAVFSNGNVTIANSPTDAGFKLNINSATTGLNVGNQTNSLKALSTFSKTLTTGFGTSNNYLQIGAGENGLNGTRLIGFGYSITGNTNQPAYIGYIETSNSGETNGSLIFGTRSVTTDTAPTTRLTIASTGAATFSSSVTVAGDLISNGGAGATRFILTSAGPGDGLGVLYDASSVAKIQLYTNGVSYFNGGNVGIGTTSPTDGRLVVEGSDVNITAKSTSNVSVFKLINTSGTSVMAQVSNALVFEHLGSEALRITSGGYTKSSNNGVYVNSTGAFHESNQNLNDGQIAVMRHSGNSSPIGLEIAFTGADPNNASNYMLGAYTTSGGFTWIYRIFSNGTVSARSDARWKKNIETTRSGYIDDLCKLRVVKYNWYNHQDDSPKELGLIAQEVEEVFPNLIQHDPVICKKQVEQKDGTFVEEEYQDGTSRSIKVSVLPYMLLKAIQEQQKQIEELKSKLS
jgi:uncharacterized RDD family membrane protein YckC